MNNLHNRLIVLACMIGSFNLCSMQPPLKKKKNNDGHAVPKPTSQTVILNASLPAYQKTYMQRKAETELIARCSAELSQEVQEKIAQYALAGNPVLLKMLSQIAVPTQEITTNDGALTALAFSSDGKMLASCSWSGMIHLWDAQRYTCSRKWVGHSQAGIAEIAFSSDNTLLISAGRDQAVRFWDPVTGNCKKLLNNFSRQDPCSAVSKSSNKYVAVGDESKVNVFDQQGTSIFTVDLDDSQGQLEQSGHCIQSMSFAGDDTKLYIATDQSLHCVDMQKQQQDYSFVLLPNQTVWSIDAHENRVYVSFSHGAVGIWDLATKNLLRLYQSPEGLIVSNVINHPENNILVSTLATKARTSFITKDMVVKLWSMHHGNRIWTGKEHKKYPVWSLAVSADGKKVATGARGGKVIVRDMTAVLDADQEVKRLTIDQALLVMAAAKKIGIPRAASSRETLLNDGSPLMNPWVPFVLDDRMMPAYNELDTELQKQLRPLLSFRQVSDSTNNNNNAT